MIMIVLKVAGVLLLLVSNSVITAGFEEKCCENNTHFDQDHNSCKHAITGKFSPLTLTCSKYLLDPEIDAEDEFLIIGDGSLVVDGTRIEKGE